MPARVAPAMRVYQEECRVRGALLGGVLAGDVTFGSAGEGRGRGLPQRLWRRAVRLMSRQEERRTGTRSAPGSGSLATIAGRYGARATGGC